MTAPQLRITDTTLRDGSHALSHQLDEQQVRSVVHALDTAGIPVIEVAHGDGLGGSSFNYGFSRQDEMELIRAAADEAKTAKIAVLLLPGIGTATALRQARDAGASIARIATHCTEADVSGQHFEAARALGMETVGFLMLAHRISPEELATQGRIMVSSGCECVYVVDSAGAMLPDQAARRVAALKAEIGSHAQVGIHAHQNLCLGVANSLAAFQAGAEQVDGALCALGAGAGNTPTEVLATCLDTMGVPTGVDATALMAAAAEVVQPLTPRLPRTDRAAIVQGRYGVYSSFLLHAERVAQRYGVPAYEILRWAGEAGHVGGQEDMLAEIALELAEQIE
jgi:4-hydroxy 2-oxovalerate aldolase